MESVAEIAAKLAKIARERQIVKKSRVADSVKQQLLAQLDQAEAGITLKTDQVAAGITLKTDLVAKSGK